MMIVAAAIVAGCVAESKPPTFLAIGKTYRVSNGVIADRITIKRDMGNGWYLVHSEEGGGEVYFNMAHVTKMAEQ